MKNLKYLLLIPLLFFAIPKNANALPNITSGMNYFIYNTDETSPTQNGTKAFSTLNSTIVYPFTSYTNNYFAFGYSGVQFVTSSIGSTNAIGYTITATYKILFDGIQNNIGNVNFGGYAKFQQGSVISEASNVEVISLTSGGATFKVTTTAQLSTTTSLSTILFDLHTKSGNFGLSYFGDKFTVQLSLLSIDVQYATSVDSAILSSLNERQKETNKKLDDLDKNQQETNKKLDDLDKNITKPDIDNNTGNDFFDNFQTADNGGISAIVTAPLILINYLLDSQGVCTDLSFKILDKDVAIPSEIIIQTLFCGICSYFLLKKLFKDIDKLKNPNNSEVSTLDL